MSKEPGKIKITWDDVEQAESVEAFIPAVRPIQPPTPKNWGNISSNATTTTGIVNAGSIWMKAWFYLGLAGLVSAFLAWALSEPSFGDNGQTEGWGNHFLAPFVIIMMSFGFGTVESIVERSWLRFITRGLASIVAGFFIGNVMHFIANVIYALLQNIIIELSTDPNLTANPAQWLVRGMAWTLFGVTSGLVFGIVSKSGKKTTSGIWGGMLGAGIGGLLFDPIMLLGGGAELSRAIGFSILGCVSGISIGLVENAMKERWLHVTGGPLAGKQFVLYQDKTIIGKSQASTIYLFKDPSIQETHAIIEKRGERSLITALGPVNVAGSNLLSGAEQILRSGDVIQVGRYTFTYSEKSGT